jgi:hypothetical protein
VNARKRTTTPGLEERIVDGELSSSYASTQRDHQRTTRTVEIVGQSGEVTPETGNGGLRGVGDRGERLIIDPAVAGQDVDGVEAHGLLG